MELIFLSGDGPDIPKLSLDSDTWAIRGVWVPLNSQELDKKGY